MEPVIRLENLSKEFKVRTEKNPWKALFRPAHKVVKAVDGVSFSIEKGEAVAFLGPNGAGKTTTTKMLTGLVYPTSGTATVLGFTPFERKNEFLKRIGLVIGNRAGLNWDLTPMQSFYLLQKIYEIPEDAYKKRLKELSELLGVEHRLDTQMRRLSLGERMKMEMIGALLHDPEVLFLDEPTIGLDIETKKNVRTFLKKIQKESGTTLILTSHDMDDIEQVCDRAIVINKGKKIHDGSLEELNRQYQKSRYVRVTFEAAPEPFREQAGIEILESKGDTFLWKVEKEAMVAFVSQVLSAYQVLDIHIESVPLEEIIAEIFAK